MLERFFPEHIVPLQPELRLDLSTSDEQQICQVTADVLSRHALPSDMLLVKNRFGKYVPQGLDSTIDMAQEFVQSAFWRSKQFDAARSLGKKELLFDKGLPDNLLTRLVRRYQWRMQLVMEEIQRLGDGTVSFRTDYTPDGRSITRSSFTQQRGVYDNKALFEVLKPFERSI